MKFKFVLLAFVFASVFLFEAHAQRYLNEITDSIKVETVTYATKDGQKLEFDIYTPALESEASKATFMYVHGGGFSGGNKKNGADFCKKMARHGYAAISLGYRLTRKGTATGFGCECTREEKLVTFRAASEDLQDATQYLIQNREHFGIDPHKIILAGSSAGAETVLNTAYQPPYCYGLDSGPVSYAGVIGMAGAITDTVKIYTDSAIPSMFFHGTCDNLVPYATAPHHYCTENQPGYIILHGSYTIAEKLRRLGKPYWLVTVCGGKHEWAGKPITNYFNEIVKFCYDFVLEGKRQQIHTIVPGDQSVCNYAQYNFCVDNP